MSKRVKITDLIDFNPTRNLKRGNNAPFVEMAALPESSRDIAYVSKREFKGGGAKFQNGDTLFARITPCLENGKTAKVNILPDGVIGHGSTEFIVMTAKLPDIDEDYVYYLAWLPAFREFAKNRMEGTSGRQRVSWQALSEYETEVPSPEIRKAAGRFLRTLDDKIQLNQQINQTLEQMAQAIFKSWFVDFDPVKAKMAALEAGGSEDDALLAAMQAIAGNALFASDAADADAATQLARLQAEHPEQYTTLRATAELFPAAMQDSELGEIPEGWSVNKIEDLIQRISVGKRYSQKTVFESGSIPVLDQGKSGIIGYHNDEPGLKASEDDPVIVFANHTCYMRLVMHDFSAIQNVLPFKGKELNIHWIYLATLGKQKFTEYKGHWPDFVIKDVVTPNNIIASHFGSIVKNLFITQFHNEQQSASLSNIRDTLLPKLLSGELSVSAAADQRTKAEEVVNVQS